MHEDSDERQQVRRALAHFWAGESIPERIVEQTVDIAASAVPVLLITEEDIAEVVQGIPPDRVRAQIAAPRVNIPTPPIMASPLGLARDEPAENPKDSRLQGRGLRERPDGGDDDTSVLPRNPRIPPRNRGSC